MLYLLDERFASISNYNDITANMLYLRLFHVSGGWTYQAYGVTNKSSWLEHKKRGEMDVSQFGK